MKEAVLFHNSHSMSTYLLLLELPVLALNLVYTCFLELQLIFYSINIFEIGLTLPSLISYVASYDSLYLCYEYVFNLQAT